MADAKGGSPVPRTVLVIGGGAAGVGAARAARATDPAATVAHYAADRPAGADDERARAALAASGVELHRAPVRAVDAAARTVTADGADPAGYDALVLTADSAEPPEVPGTGLAGVVAVDRFAAGTEATRAVVVGATPRGLAAAAELAGRGVETHLVDPAEQLLAGTVDPDLATVLAEQLAAAGVRLQLSTTVAELLGSNGRLRAVRTSTGELPADLAVLAGTTPPDPRAAQSAGLSLDPDGRVRVDDRLRTSVTGVFAAGALCAPPGPLPGRTSSHEHAQGRVAGANAAGADRRYHAAYVAWSSAAGAGVVGGAGYGETAAAAAGLDYVLGRAEGISRARYYPGVQKVAVKLLAEPGSLRLIGAQLRGGGEGVRERANFLAQAVRLGVTLHELSTMENVYSPAIGALNEPIVVAATNGLLDLATATN
jgi:NADH oxidase (H2O2-forming)